MSVRVSPISRGAAVSLMLLGAFTYFFVDHLAGLAFLALGIVLYWLLFRFSRKLNREIGRAVEATPRRKSPKDSSG